jgi:hypothetical protein
MDLWFWASVVMALLVAGLLSAVVVLALKSKKSSSSEEFSDLADLPHYQEETYDSEPDDYL